MKHFSDDSITVMPYNLYCSVFEEEISNIELNSKELLKEIIDSIHDKSFVQDINYSR